MAALEAEGLPISMLAKARAFLFNRRNAYLTAFAGRAGERVLADLAAFCRAHESTFHADPRVAAMLDGRREVWNRIAHHLHLSDDKLWQLYGRKDS